MRYFFHLRETGQYTTDEEGCELPDVDAAVATAVESARSIMADEAMAGRIDLTSVIEVEDVNGWPVTEVPFDEALIVVKGWAEWMVAPRRAGAR